jgi:hypothetical protein
VATSYTYATLVADLQAFLEDNGADFEGSIDSIIALGEERVLRDMDLSIFDAVSEETLSANTDMLTKPSGTLFARFISTSSRDGRHYGYGIF